MSEEYTPFKMKGMPMIQGSNSHKQAVEGSSPAKQDWLKYLNPITAANKVADLIKGTDESKSKAEPNTYQAKKRHEKNKNKMTKEEAQKMADETMNPKKTFSDSISQEQRDKADKQYIKKREDAMKSYKGIEELDKEKKEKKKVATKVKKKKKKKILDLTPSSPKKD